MASKLWLSLCLVLFAYNLMDLLSDRYSLNYKIVEEGDVFFDNVEDLNYLVCAPFAIIKSENYFLNYKQALKNVSVKNFLNSSIASIRHRLKTTNLFRLNESCIFNDNACFSTTKKDLEMSDRPLNKFFNIYRYLRIFIYSKEKQPIFHERAYWKRDVLPFIYIRAYKQKIFGENHLLYPNCFNRANQIHYDRLGCLNRCFTKLKGGSSFSFYHVNADEVFDLNKLFGDTNSFRRDMSLEEDSLEVVKLITLSEIEKAEDCLKKCPERSCFWEIIITSKIDNFYYNNHLRKEGKDKVSLKLNTYVAFYSMNDFYLQFFSLLALFTGTTALSLLNALFSRTFEKLEAYLKNQKLLRLLRLAHPNLRHVLTLLGFVLVLIQGLNMLNEFKFNSAHPNKTTTLNFSSEPFSIVLCFPIENAERDRDIKENRNSVILNNFSFAVIEEYSNHLKHSETDSIVFLSGGQTIKAESKFLDEVLFKSSRFKGQSCLSRCFRVDFDLDDEKYRKMPLTYLVMGFDTAYKEVFIIERNQSFTSSLVNYIGHFGLQKVTKKYSAKSKKSNCRDYSGEEGCNSRRNCLDRCLSTRFIAKHRSIPTNTVVSKSDLNSSWLADGIKFNETEDGDVKERCLALHNQTDCIEAYFEESSQMVSLSTWYIKIKLSYMNIVEMEIEHESVATLMDIVSLETIFFGSNVLGILTTIFIFLSRSFRFKWYRAYSMILFLMAGIGFLTHNALVFQSIISGDLMENEFFEKPDQYRLPSPIFCFEIDEIEKKIDVNHRLTGEYLDDLTSEMTFKYVFWGVVYSNRTHHKALNISRLNFTSSSNFYSSSELELTHFYYSGLKCFKISLKISYNEDDFLFLEDKIAFTVFLNTPFKNANSVTFFIHQQADSSEIGGGISYRIGESHDDTISHYSYNIEFELFKIVRDDQFELLKDPRRLFQERIKVDDAETEDAIRKRFKDDYNLTTMDPPLDRDFDTQVDNELFEQHSRTLLDQASFKSRNFKSGVANTYTSVFRDHLKPDFLFTFSFLVRRVEITNRENYTKLVVSLLDTLSLWLDICVLDMGAWLSHIFRLLLNLYHLLVSFRARIHNLRVPNVSRVRFRPKRTRRYSV